MNIGGDGTIFSRSDAPEMELRGIERHFDRESSAHLRFLPASQLRPVSQVSLVNMASYPTRPRPVNIVDLLLLLCLVPICTALKFDLYANVHSGKNERCIRNFVPRDQLVVVTANVGGQKGDGQVVNMHVCLFLPAVILRHFVLSLVYDLWKGS